MKKEIQLKMTEMLFTDKHKLKEYLINKINMIHFVKQNQQNCWSSHFSISSSM